MLKDREDAHDPVVERNARYKIRFSLLVSCAVVASIGDQVAVFQGTFHIFCECPKKMLILHRLLLFSF